jgi:hypothetical protein
MLLEEGAEDLRYDGVRGQELNLISSYLGRKLKGILPWLFGQIPLLAATLVSRTKGLGTVGSLKRSWYEP